MDPATAEAWYGFLAAVVRTCPGALQAEGIATAEELYQDLWGWRRDSRTDADRRRTAARVAEFAGQLRAWLPTVCVTWDAVAPAAELPPGLPLRLAHGLARPLFVELRNQTPAAVNLAVHVDGQENAALPPVGLPAGATRPVLLWVVARSPATALGLTVADTAPGGRALSVPLPVAVEEPATLRGTIVDADTGAPWPGRVAVRCSDGLHRHARAFADNPTLSEKPVIFRPAWHRLPFFYSDGHFEITVPPGPTVVTLERGFEHEIVTRTVEARPGQTHELTLRSGRFLDMLQRGWVSGDTHVHWTTNAWDTNEDLALLALVQRAEDVRVVNNLTLYQYRPAAAGGPFVKPDPFPMGPVPGRCDDQYHIQMAEEYRNDRLYGHINLLGLRELIEPLATGAGSGGDEQAMDWPHNRTAIEACHAQGGLSAEAHGFGPCENGDAAVNAVLGLADLMDQLDAPYYELLLNAGVRVPLGNGSDHPARVLGCARLYVRIEGPFAYAAWLDGIRAGRTFVTSGPLLFLTLNGREVGARLDVPAGTELRVEAQAVSRYPLGNLQVVSNGEVIGRLTTTRREARLRLRVRADTPRWFVARCSPTDEFTAIKTAEEAHTARPGIAHTSALYVDVDGRPAFGADAARQLRERLLRHADDVARQGRFADDSQRRAAVELVQAAVRLLETRLATTARGKP